MAPKPRPPHEERLRMALEAARTRDGDERSAFLAWLRAADPDLAVEVEERLAADGDGATEGAPLREDP